MNLVKSYPSLNQGASLLNSQMKSCSFQMLIPQFIDYAVIELRRSRQTVAKYEESLRWLLKYLPHVQSPTELTFADILLVKRQMLERGVTEARVNSIIFALRAFIHYCQVIHQLTTINPSDIKPMKIPKRQVSFLNEQEINTLLNGINVNDKRGLRIRALMEFLLGTGMRISEALSLNRGDIDWNNQETMVVGKGNKQRSIFITSRAKLWLEQYLASRQDEEQALFVTFGDLKRLTRFDLSKQFKRYSLKAGLAKKVTPHLLRHSAATLMLKNGCDIRYIQELLGHSDIQTTAQYYLGTDKRSLKEAHAKFLKFD